MLEFESSNALERGMDNLGIKWIKEGEKYIIPTDRENLSNFLKASFIMQKDLQSRINNAIEFIKEKGQYNEESNIFGNNVSFWELKELVSILEGEDNE